MSFFLEESFFRICNNVIKHQNNYYQQWRFIVPGRGCWWRGAAGKRRPALSWVTTSPDKKRIGVMPSVMYATHGLITDNTQMNQTCVFFFIIIIMAGRARADIAVANAVTV